MTDSTGMPPWGGRISPELSAEELAALAAERPDLWPQIAIHPNVYPDLQQWIAAQQAAAPVAPAAYPGIEPGSAASGSKKNRFMVVFSLLLVFVLLLASIGVALAMNKVWPFDTGGPVSSLMGYAASEEERITFADGIEKRWTITDDDLNIGGLFLGGWGGAYPRGFSEEAPLNWLPRVFDGGLLLPAAQDGDNDVASLTLLSPDDGSVVWKARVSSSGTKGGSLGCTSAADDSLVFCVFAAGQDSELYVLDENGERARTELPGRYIRFSPDATGVSLLGAGTVARTDLDGKLLWSVDTRLEISDTWLATIESSADRTLVRAMPGGWELFDATGTSLAFAEGWNADPDGLGYLGCDASLAGHRLFVNGECTDTSAPAGMQLTKLAQVPAGRSLLAGEGTLALALGYPDSKAYPVYDAASGEYLWDAGNWPSPNMTLGDEALAEWDIEDLEYTVRNLGTGSTRFTTAAPSPSMQSSKASFVDGVFAQLWTDHEYASELVGHDPSNGDELWSVDVSGQGMWLYSAERGLVVSDIGSDFTEFSFTFYAPADAPAEVLAAGDIEVPASIPVSCPAGTILLAWAELPDGWVLVCGITLDVPTFVAYQASGGGGVQYSSGATNPTGTTAQAAVVWDSRTNRYAVDLAKGNRLTFDGNMGTVTVRDEDAGQTVDQQRALRILVVLLGSGVRTSDDLSSGTGAFEVPSPDDSAEDQVRYMVEVLEKAYEGRAMVKDALPKLRKCTASAGGYGDSIAAMESVRDNRAELLAALAAMPVDRIPDGEQLLDDLTEGIQQSYNANLAYVEWAEQANRTGCASLSAAGKASVAASDAPKERFAKRWNRVVAPKFGVRTFDGWYI